MNEIVEKIHSLLASALILESPVLSGNMKQHISSYIPDGNTSEIIIDAPFYDLKKWEKTKVIVHTGETINGRTAYAEEVNRIGAFGKKNKSTGWATRTIHSVVDSIANEVGATVIYEI